METKTITVDVNWLEDIDGCTVADAIKYLQTLDQSHKLSYYMDGDTHGCDVVANLYYYVPITNEEILAKHEKHYTKEIALYEKAKQANIAAGNTQRAESCETNLVRLRAKWAEIQAKYGKE